MTSSRLLVTEATETSEIHSSLKYSMFLCRLMGLFPVAGLLHPTKDKLRCTWRSLYTVVYIITILNQFVNGMFSTHHFMTQTLSLSNMSNFIFNSIGFISTLSILKLAWQWPEFIYEVACLENSLPLLKEHITKKCNIISLSIMILALVEHLLSVTFSMKFVMTCWLGDNLLENYFTYSVPAVFDYTSFAVWKAVFFEIANVQATFLWTFTDVIIMMFAIYLKAYFDELNKYIKINKGIISTPWHNVRLQYSYLVRMVRLIDSHLNTIILVSFFSNLFFICLQLFNILNHGHSGLHACEKQGSELVLRGLEHTLYYTFSFVFLVIRAAMVSLMAANVNTAAHEPMLSLYDVPATAYSIEVQRFHRQVTYTTVAFSGFNFFYVTRRMILSVVGTIVTYELVMFQFNTDTRGYDDGTFNLTTITSNN